MEEKERTLLHASDRDGRSSSGKRQGTEQDTTLRLSKRPTTDNRTTSSSSSSQNNANFYIEDRRHHLTRLFSGLSKVLINSTSFYTELLLDLEKELKMAILRKREHIARMSESQSLSIYSKHIPIPLSLPLSLPPECHTYIYSQSDVAIETNEDDSDERDIQRRTCIQQNTKQKEEFERERLNTDISLFKYRITRCLLLLGDIARYTAGKNNDLI
jgi:hypothetical protein